MTLSSINAAIASLGTIGGATIIENTRAPLVKGRAGIPVSTLTAVTDVVHGPDPSTSVIKTRDSVKAGERVVAYFRTEVAPVVVNPDGASPWWLVIDDRIFEVDSVEEWRAGGFWAAHATRVHDWKTRQQVRFASLDRTVLGGSNASIAAAIIAGSLGYAGSRSFRVAVAEGTADGPASYDDADFTYDDTGVAYDGDGLLVFGIAWHTDLDAMSDAPVFRAVGTDGETIEVEPITGPTAITVSGTSWTFVVLPSHVDANGAHRYEVIG